MQAIRGLIMTVALVIGLNGNAIAQAAAPVQVMITQRAPAYGIPGAAHTVLAFLNKGDALDLLGRSRDRKWWQVSFQGQPLWIESAAGKIVGRANRIKSLPTPRAPKLPKPEECTAINERDGFAEGGLPWEVTQLRDGSCLQLTLRTGEKQLWLWHPSGSTVQLTPFAPVLLRFGPWGLPMQNLYGSLMHVGWVKDDKQQLRYVAGAPILRRDDMLYYEITPLLQDQGKPGRQKFLLMTDVHILERIQ